MSSRALAAIALLLVGGGGAAVALGAGGSSDPAPASAARAASDPPVTKLSRTVSSELAQAPDGGFITTADDYDSDRQSTSLVRIPEAGGRAVFTPIVPPPSGSARVSSVLSAVSSFGAVAAALRRASGPESRSAMVVTTVRPDGARVSEQRVRGLPRGASPWALAIGPTGAVGLLSLAPSTGRGLGAMAWFSFRPAGASRFVAAVALPFASLPSEDGSEVDDSAAAQPRVVMAPDGSAAVIDALTSSLRRVTPGGKLGDAAFLTRRPVAGTAAAFRDDGTLVAASTRLVASKTKTIDDQFYSSRIVVGEWKPGQPRPEIRGLPLHPGEVNGGENFSLALGPGNRTLLVLAEGDHQLALLSGIGTAIEPVDPIPAPRARNARALPQADGGTTLLWARDATDTTFDDSALLAATAAPGAAFAAARTIHAAGRGSLTIQAAVPLSDGRLAITFNASPGGQNLLVAQP